MKEEVTRVMELFLMRVATGRETGAPVPSYLIRTDDGTDVLVDTGVPLPPAEGAPWEADAADGVVAQLARVGVKPGDVDYVVCSHLDPDHAGNNDAFPEATFVVQRRQYEAARSGRYPRFEMARGHWDRPGLRYELVNGDAELVKGVKLIESGGHAPGHQSVLVRLPETGPVLLAIDAVPFVGALDPEARPITSLDSDADDVRASTRKLVGLAVREGVRLIVHGHDADQWRRLRVLPDRYS